jgi:hypothetical protein
MDVNPVAYRIEGFGIPDLPSDPLTNPEARDGIG